MKQILKNVSRDDLLKVDWDDIVVDSTWMDEEDAEKHPLNACVSVGHFLNCKSGVFRLSGTVSKKERDCTAIPVGCINKISMLDITDDLHEEQKDD